MQGVRESEEAFDDAGEGTMADSLVRSNISDIANTMLKSNTEAGLKHRCEFLSSIGLSCRGEQLRMLKLCGMGLMEFPNEGVHGAKILRTVWRK